MAVRYTNSTKHWLRNPGKYSVVDEQTMKSRHVPDTGAARICAESTVSDKPMNQFRLFDRANAPRKKT